LNEVTREKKTNRNSNRNNCLDFHYLPHDDDDDADILFSKKQTFFACFFLHITLSKCLYFSACDLFNYIFNVHWIIYLL